MVIPVGNKVQKMKLIVKISNNDYETYDFGDFNFVPMLKNIK